MAGYTKFHPLFGGKLHLAKLAPKHHGINYRLVIFQTEILVTAAQAEIG